MENQNTVKRSATERFAPLAINAGLAIGAHTIGNKLQNKAFDKAINEKKNFQAALYATAGSLFTSTATLLGMLLPITAANAMISRRDFTVKVEDIKNVDVIEA